MSSPTQRSLALLRKHGWLCQVVERWVGKPGSFGVRQDLFGCIDILAIKGHIALAIQATSDNGGNMSAHVDKCLAEERLGNWLEVGFFEVWAWAKRGPRGKRKTYRLRRQPIVHQDGGSLEESTLEHDIFVSFPDSVIEDRRIFPAVLDA